MSSSISRHPDIYLLILLFLLTRASFPLFSDIPSGNEFLKLESKGIIDDITAFNFSKADKKIQIMKDKNPETFYPSFLKVYKYYWRYLLSPYSAKATSEFKDALNSTINISRKPKYRDNRDAELFRACSYLFLAILDYTKKNFLSSFYQLKKGIKGIDTLSKNPATKGDALFILGCYDYYRLTGNGETSMAKLNLAASEGFYFKDIALLMLAKLYQKEKKDFRASIEIYRNLNRRYPANSLIYFYLAKNTQTLGKHRESLKLFENTLKTIHYKPHPLEMMCLAHFSSGQICEFKLKDYPRAAEEYKAAYNLADASIQKTKWFIPWSALHLGAVYEKMGKNEKALYYLRKVLKKDDNHAYEKAQKIIRHLSK